MNNETTDSPIYDLDVTPFIPGSAVERDAIEAEAKGVPLRAMTTLYTLTQTLMDANGHAWQPQMTDFRWDRDEFADAEFARSHSPLEAVRRRELLKLWPCQEPSPALLDVCKAIAGGATTDFSVQYPDPGVFTMRYAWKPERVECLLLAGGPLCRFRGRPKHVTGEHSLIYETTISRLYDLDVTPFTPGSAISWMAARAEEAGRPLRAITTLYEPTTEEHAAFALAQVLREPCSPFFCPSPSTLFDEAFTGQYTPLEGLRYRELNDPEPGLAPSSRLLEICDAIARGETNDLGDRHYVWLPQRVECVLLGDGPNCRYRGAKRDEEADPE